MANPRRVCAASPCRMLGLIMQCFEGPCQALDNVLASTFCLGVAKKDFPGHNINSSC